jgi:chromate transporter
MEREAPTEPSQVAPHSLAALAVPFLKLGTIAFGGPAAHIAMMEDEFVRRRAWLSREDFLDLVGAASLIPGPSSTEVAIFIGYRRAGWRGLLVAGSCFILPAAVLVSVIAWSYVRFGALPEASAMLYGVKAIIIVIVVQAIAAFGRTAIKSNLLFVIGAAAIVASVLGVSPLAVFLAAGTLHAIVTRRAGPPPTLALAWLGPLGAAGSTTAAAGAAPATLTKLFLVFLKTGAVVFGSGYVLLAFLRADLVERTHWLTDRQLIDAVAVGQITPGPVFTTAAFVGYLLGGPAGAAVATLGIFLPSFVFVAASGPLIPRIRRSKVASAFLDGVNVASLALMAVVTVQLGHAALVDLPAVGIAVVGAILLFRFRVSSGWLVLGAAIAGSLVQHLQSAPAP